MTLVTLGDNRKSLYCHPYTTDCQIAVLRGDNSDIILKKKNSYKTNGIEIYDRVEVRGEVIIVLIVPLWN